MTLLAEIQSKCSAELIASRDFDAIAAAVNVGRTRYRKTELGDGSIIAAIGDLNAANAFLDVVKSTSPTSPFRHVKDVIFRGAFDMGDLMAQASVQSMVPAILTQEQADNLKALGVEPDHVTAQQVSDAMGG